MPYRFSDLKKACPTGWQDYIEHSFVRQLGDATLAPEAFQHYLKQDYLFLIQFARAFALAAYKSPTLAYTRYVLDTGNRGDLSPCMVGYGEIANWLNNRNETIRGEGNPYDAWIAMYESDEFQQLATSVSRFSRRIKPAVQ